MAISLTIEEYNNLLKTNQIVKDSVEAQVLKSKIKNEKRSAQSRANNQLGQGFESLISYACKDYKKKGIADIRKTPEPFRVIKKQANGRFVGQFSNENNAQPDYTGTLYGGRSIMFEAKATATDIMRRNVLSETQMEILESHHNMGAKCFVLISIKDRYFNIPWVEWRDMKKVFGKVSLRVEDIENYEVKQKEGIVLAFL